jgi:hypothetical protein
MQHFVLNAHDYLQAVEVGHCAGLNGDIRKSRVLAAFAPAALAANTVALDAQATRVQQTASCRS